MGSNSDGDTIADKLKAKTVNNFTLLELDDIKSCKSNFYYLKNGFKEKVILEAVRAKFASLIVFQTYKMQVSGVKFWILELGFKDGEDYKNSNIITVCEGNTLVAVNSELIDKQGNFVGLPEQKVVITGLSHRYFADLDTFKSNFSKYFDFFSDTTKFITFTNYTFPRKFSILSIRTIYIFMTR